MSSSTLAYSTVTGQAVIDADIEVTVEHHRPTNLRVTDPRYGLKTAAKTAAETKKRREEREAFLTARRASLTVQRDGIQGRLDNLQKEIRKVIGGLESGKIAVSDHDDAFARLQRMGATEAKLVSDIARLNSKIGV